MATVFDREALTTLSQADVEVQRQHRHIPELRALFERVPEAMGF